MRLRRSIPVALTVLLVTIPAYAASGDPDPTFGGGDGMATADSGDRDEGFALAVRSNGKILQAGEFGPGLVPDFNVARYKRNGAIDTGFGGDGLVQTDFLGGFDGAAAVIPLPRGKVLVAGTACTADDSDCHFALARYKKGGALDTTFGGGDGKVTTNFPGEAFLEDAIVLDDRTIVAVGGNSDSATGLNDFALAKYKANGKLDRSFSGDGKKTVDLLGGDDFASNVVEAEDRILVAGSATDGPSGADFDVAVARFKMGGRLDKKFSGDGKRLLALSAGESDQAVGLVRLPDGRFVVASSVGATRDTGLARFKPKGRLDTSFGGGDGIVVQDLAGEPRDLALLRRKYAVAANTSAPQMAVALFGRTGRLKTGFGTGGLAEAVFPDGSTGWAVAAQDGKILVGGSATKAFPGLPDMGVARFQP